MLSQCQSAMGYSPRSPGRRINSWSKNMRTSPCENSSEWQYQGAKRRYFLVEQYRIPVHARTIELPAGIVGDEPGSSNESQAEAARRELLEETGYAADNFVPLMMGPSCSGLTSERVTLFHATGLRRAGKGGGVANEEITTHEIPMAEVPRWLETKASTGILIDPKIYAGLFFLTKNK